ncbi:MAG: phosphate acyltransferase [Isosphaeraceae bacterium]
MTALPTFDELHRLADRQAPGLGVAVAGGDDPTVLQALESAVERGWIRPRVFGPERAVRSMADEIGVRLKGMDLVSCEADDVARAAVAEVSAGGAGAVMKGQIATPTLMKSVLDAREGLRTGRVICQVVLMEILHDGRRFLLADTGITVRPDLEEKDDILRSSVEVARALGTERPRVALMAATETVKPSMPETLDAEALTKRHEARGDPDFLVQGPLSFDLAYAPQAGARKRLAGAVVGAADAMVFPDLLSANLTVKAIMYTADCRFGGVLRGTSAPVVFMSRADDMATRLNSLALTLAILRSDLRGQEARPRERL